MIHKNIVIPKTARYFILGKPSAKIEKVWFVCHGYGELAPYFLKKFDVLNDDKTLIVAPEALNRFYREGFTGKVGASWMTREEREHEIADYVNYLHAVYTEVLALVNNGIRVSALGFSQGTAAVSRWLVKKRVPLEKLVLWAGFLPHDLNFDTDKDYLNSINCHFIMGKEDEFYNNNSIQEQLMGLTQKGIKHCFTYFNGKHEMNGEALSAIVSQKAGHK